MVRGDRDDEPEAGMQIILIFAALFIGLNAVSVGICSIIESYSSYVSLICFLGLFIVNVVVAWKVALFITERFLLTQAQREENERRAQALKSPYGYRA